EQYPSLENLEAGDLVMADVNNAGFVVKTTGEYSNNVIGVVSDAPGLLLAAETDGYPIALVGRIPTKVSGVNGAIQSGDVLTVAPFAGRAMKLNDGESGIIIGTALESFSGAGDGVIMMFINPDYRATFDMSTFGQITDGQIATNAAISDLKLDTIKTAGKVALSALPVEIALLQGETQTFTGNYIFGASSQTEDLVVFNSHLGSGLNFAVDGLYNIGSATATAANIYTDNLYASKLVISQDHNVQNLNLDDYGLYLSATSGSAYFGQNVLIGAQADQLEIVLPDYPEFALDGGDLLVIDDLGLGGDLYVGGSIRVAGRVEYQGQGSAQYLTIDGNVQSGDVVAVN
ncbi:MAG: hypothetical protein COU22_01500, partial [Candidatus Komeilibacteria bacterium CG10_big_fil_rev_8_21_14_0_10_41_13]